MKTKEMKIRLILTEGMLGTKSGNEELLKEYIASKHPESIQQDELDTMPDLGEELDKGTTFFNRDEDGNPFIFDYQVKGFFKDAQGCLNRIPSTKMAAYKKIIDGLVFIKERRIKLNLPKGESVQICERPLRAQTPQGERVSIARSEEVPTGTTLEFTVILLEESLEKQIRVWFDYGIFRGLGQWRNSGKGKFEYEVLN